MSFDILIYQNKNKFSKNDNKLIEYLKKHADAANELTIQKISDDLKIGFSSIYGLLKKLGLKSFKDLLILINTSNVMNDINTNQLPPSKFNISDIYKEIIKNNEIILDVKALEKTIECINKSTNILFVGLGESYLISRSLSNRFERMGIKSSVAQTESGMLLVKTNLLSKGDLLICVSVSGESSVIVEAAKLAKNNNATVVSICGSKNSSLQKQSDVCNNIYFDTESKLKEIMINPLSSFSWFCDVLTQKLIENDYNYLIKYRSETNLLISKNTKINNK